MTEKRERTISPEKLKVDKKKQYTINLPDGEKITTELNNKEIEAIENWFPLVSKHPLRFNIISILRISAELNITQISNMVEQSKSTVARHLKLMEEDGLIISRKADKYQKGKIPPKLYQLNWKLLKIVENSPINLPPPEDPKKLTEFYRREIDINRVVIYSINFLLNLLNPLLDNFEEQLENIPQAKKIYETYFDMSTTKSHPIFGHIYFSEKYYDKFREIYFSFLRNIIELLAVQNNDPEVRERAYCAVTAVLPIKALYDVIKKNMKDKKQQN